MADARIRILFGQRETIKEFEREFWGMTLLGETKREVPVRTEPHPTLSFRSSPARPLIFRTIHGRRLTKLLVTQRGEGAYLDHLPL
jgi:hypothetical protein